MCSQFTSILGLSAEDLERRDIGYAMLIVSTRDWVEPVFIHKLIAKGAVEESIQVLQKKKADLVQAMLSPAGETQNVRLTQDDLQAIFAPLSDA